MTIYIDAANESFKSLLWRWNNMSIVTGPSAPKASFWIAGNTLQTFLDYWINCRQPADADILRQFLNYFYMFVRTDINKDDLDNIAERALNKGRLWLDDFGWWGNAFVSACENGEALNFSGDDVQIFLQAAINCWELMHRGYDIPPSPVMPGGIWNTKVQKLEPNEPDLHGRNNVTNTQFWLLSFRLAALTHDTSKYLSRWQDIRKWLEDLYKGNLLFDADSLFVRERFKGATGEKWTDGFYWAGDQGLFLNCMEIDNRSVPPFSDLKTKVLDYVLNNMCDDAKVLHDQRIVTTAEFNNDYATGKGVFFKHILKTAQADPNQRLYDCVMSSAAHAWNTKSMSDSSWTYDFRFGWNDNGKLPLPGNWDTNDNTALTDFRKLILHVSAMDVMTTAAALNPSGIIPEFAKL